MYQCGEALSSNEVRDVPTLVCRPTEMAYEEWTLRANDSEIAVNIFVWKAEL